MRFCAGVKACQSGLQTLTFFDEVGDQRTALFIVTPSLSLGSTLQGAARQAKLQSGRAPLKLLYFHRDKNKPLSTLGNGKHLILYAFCKDILILIGGYEIINMGYMGFSKCLLKSPCCGGLFFECVYFFLPGPR